MKIRVHSVAGKLPAWVASACTDYERRMPRGLQPEWVTLPLGKRPGTADPEEFRTRDTERLARSVPADSHVVALDVKGASWSTDRLADQFALWQHSGTDISLVVGGPEGLTPGWVQQADQAWSLSPLTLPHPLVRVILVEQLYRAWTLLQGHPYHK